MSEDRPRMDAPTMLRRVRHMLMQVNRKMLQSRTREDSTTHGTPLAGYAARRDVRQFERRILNSRALHRVAVAYASRITGSTEFDLYSSQLIAAADLGATYTSTSTYDAADYYAPSDEHAGFDEDNNEY
jgi:hypothetical protein